MHKISAKETVSRLDKIFTRLGYPRTITLDNAKQFVGTEFEEYSRIHAIHLNHSTPYWPQENGLVERQNRSLLKRLQISNALGRDWKRDLQDYLMMYYTTPHSVTGRTPTELMYGHTIRSKIPVLNDFETVITSTDFADKDWESKEKGKDRENIKRKSKRSSIDCGDSVLMQNLLPGNKLQTTYNPKKYVVLSRSGPRVTIEDPLSGKSYDRNVAHLKKVIAPDESASFLASNMDEQPSNKADDELSVTSVEDEFCGFEAGPLSEISPPVSLPDRQQRARKKPARFEDYQL